MFDGNVENNCSNRPVWCSPHQHARGHIPVVCCFEGAANLWGFSQGKHSQIREKNTLLNLGAERCWDELDFFKEGKENEAPAIPCFFHHVSKTEKSSCSYNRITEDSQILL